MRSIFNKLSTSRQPGGRPPGAVEITPAGVLAGAVASAGAAPLYAFVALPAGALTPSLDAVNLGAPDAVAAAIRAALDEVLPRSRAVTLVLPDLLIRVFVLDFDALPAKAAEALPVLRFRLRKMVPFDVEHAGLSYQVLSQSKDECRVLTAVTPGPILAEYEAAVRAAGYEPGAVLSSSLAALETVDSLEAVLGANLSADALTTTIAAGEDLLLYRTLDLPQDPADRVLEIRRGIAVAAAYYEDKLHVRPSRLRYAGSEPLAEVAGWIGDPELEMTDFVPRPESGLTTSLGAASLAGVAGALSLPGERAGLR
jgi:type IV pilus assembly protein PilM